MKAAQFSSKKKTGELVAVSGLPGITHAFLPEPLPPDWKWPVRLWPLLLEARTALASLDGTGRHLLNPELVLVPLQNREAQRSSSLEGTYTDPREQALFQLEPKYPESGDDPINANREVFNYVRALRLRGNTKNTLPISLRLIRELHRILMEGVRGSDRNPGEFRRSQNQIGRPARFVPSPATHLASLLDAFEKYLHAGATRFDPLVNAFLVHYQFEAIHPFLDGNGRVGRLLLSVLIAEWCRLSNEWLYMSAYFDHHKDEYIGRLFRISTHGEWEKWVEFCLRGVVVQANDTLGRCENLLALHQQYHDKLRRIGGSVRLSGIVDDLFKTPVASVVSVARSCKVSYPTAASDLKKLARAGIVEKINDISRIAYYCPAIFKVTYAD
ncbi:MAG: Fic family protein [Gemmatimonadaceae bacterium]